MPTWVKARVSAQTGQSDTELFVNLDNVQYVDHDSQKQRRKFWFASGASEGWITKARDPDLYDKLLKYFDQQSL
jgi:hypothetical protein